MYMKFFSSQIHDEKREIMLIATNDSAFRQLKGFYKVACISFLMEFSLFSDVLSSINLHFSPERPCTLSRLIL